MDGAGMNDESKGMKYYGTQQTLPMLFIYN